MLARKFFISVLLLLTFSLSTTVAFAASLSVTHIGALNTNGSKYSEWWYTGTNPVLKGAANSGSNVNITIDSSSYSTTADSEGSWSYSSTLAYGDHTVKVDSNGESYTFTLHLTQTLPETFGSTATSQTSESTMVPQTGSNILLAGVSGGLLFAFGLSQYSNVKSKNNIISSIRESK